MSTLLYQITSCQGLEGDGPDGWWEKEKGISWSWKSADRQSRAGEWEKGESVDFSWGDEYEVEIKKVQKYSPHSKHI